jgi:hypothetical protein
LRAVLLERGVILPKRRAPLRHRLHELLAGNCRSVPGYYGCCRISVKSGKASMSGSELMTTSSPR